MSDARFSSNRAFQTTGPGGRSVNDRRRVEAQPRPSIPSAWSFCSAPENPTVGARFRQSSAPGQSAERTRKRGAGGLVLGIGSIPFVALPLPAGSLIARIGARQTMVIADAARLPLLAAIPALYSLDALSFPLLVVLVALTNVCLAAHMPRSV